MSAEELSQEEVRLGVSRQQALAETFVALADTLVADFDVVDLLDRLANSCVSLLGVDAAGILVDDQKGNLAVLASSSEEIRVLEAFQIQNNQGPCLDCFRTGTSVTSVDIELESYRWPLFTAAAHEAGYRSVLALPMRLRDQTIGGLNLFLKEAKDVPAEDRRLAQALADVATIGILHRRSAHRSDMLAEQLQFALTSRVVIEQAKGVIAERNDVSMDTAFNGLRQFARSQNLKLTDVALSVVRGELDPRTDMTTKRTRIR
jgi:transcriptional regulator with GAF, ATPase, and Fis domain